MTKFKELSLESRSEFSASVDEGKDVAKAFLQAALDSADMAARAMVSAVVMWRSSWLHSSRLLYKVQQTIQDLPYDGNSLFSEQIDVKLHNSEDSRATLSPWVSTPQPQLENTTALNPWPSSVLHNNTSTGRTVAKRGTRATGGGLHPTPRWPQCLPPRDTRQG